MTPLEHRTLHEQWNNWMKNFKDTPPWQSIQPPTASLPHHAGKLRKVIDELDVENAARYKPSGSSTYCNIFVSDVLTAMGLQPGHWVTDDGDPAEDGHGWELNANRMVRWFRVHGAENGWEETDRPEACDAAARGHVVVVAWDSQSPGPGHIAIMLPEGSIAQAGRKNFVGGTIREGFGTKTPRFFVQLHGGSHNA